MNTKASVSSITQNKSPDSHSLDTQVMNRFMELFNGFPGDSVEGLDSVYHPQVSFTDPLTTVHGLANLKDYMRDSYQNVKACHFDFAEPICSGGEASVGWVMRLQHDRIRGGEEISVDGCSLLRLENGLIIDHRDYFDLGQMLYENLPVLGRLVRWVRSQAS